MKNLIPKWVSFSLLTVSFVGFLDSFYLTTKHYSGTALNCSLLHGCEQVTTSQYSTFFNIPIALLGVLYYLTIFILISLYLDTKNKRILTILPFLTPIGFLASGYFVYLQLFTIKAICIYCMLSALTSTAIFILSIFVVKYKKVVKNNN